MPNPIQPSPRVVPIVGQPFTLLTAVMPVDVSLRCNCGGEDVSVLISDLIAAACPSCGKVYRAAFNPLTTKLEINITVPNKQVHS